MGARLFAARNENKLPFLKQINRKLNRTQVGEVDTMWNKFSAV
jgi:hypothetical protein